MDYSRIDYFKNEDNFIKKRGITSTRIYGSTISKPRITIAIPTCLRVRTLKDALESALRQNDFEDYEVMVVDDNSTPNDETEQFMSLYKENPKVAYYKNTKNLSMAGNFNRIMELTKTDYVVILHDDDIISPDYLRIIFPFAIKHDADIVTVDTITWNEIKAPLPIFKRNTPSSYIKMKPAYLFNLCRCLPTGMLIKKKMVINEGGFDERFHPSIDYVFLGKTFFKYKAYKYKEKLLIYRWAENVSMKLDSQIRFIFIDHYFKKQLGKKLGYPQWFINFVCKKDALIRYKRITEDYGEQVINLEGKRLSYPSFANRIIFKIYDLLDDYRYKLKVRYDS